MLMVKSIRGSATILTKSSKKWLNHLFYCTKIPIPVCADDTLPAVIPHPVTKSCGT